MTCPSPSITNTDKANRHNQSSGTYTIVAVEGAWGFEWQKPGILDRSIQHGQDLTVGALMRGTVHVPSSVEVQPRRAACDRPVLCHPLPRVPPASRFFRPRSIKKLQHIPAYPRQSKQSVLGSNRPGHADSPLSRQNGQLSSWRKSFAVQPVAFRGVIIQGQRDVVPIGIGALRWASKSRIW